MSIRLMAKVFESDLPTMEKFVLLSMADYASDSGESIFPSVQTLARKTSLSERSVQRAIQNLLESGYLELVKEGGGRSNTNLYKIRCQRVTLSSEKGDSQTVKGDTQSIKGDPQSPDSSLTTTLITKNSVPEKPLPEMPAQLKTPRTEEDIRKMTMDALFGGIGAHAEKVARGEFDTDHFPADVQDIVGQFCRLWAMDPPAAGSPRFSWWVKGGRALLDACAEFKEELLAELREELKGSELTISSPSSLVNLAAALAGKKRAAVVVTETAKDESYYWNSDLSEEENLRLMHEKRKSQK